jgi:hypothetical protein
MEIGTSKLTGGTTKKEWFDIKAGESNFYRILPPLFSLAQKGKYSQYFASHSVWITDSASGKRRPYNFQCLEIVNRQTKDIERHCPFCDKARANKMQYEAAKAKGADPEKLEEFRKKHVNAYESEKKHYTNAVSIDNKVGVLKLGIKAHEAMKARIIEISNTYQIDPTGMEGLFLNFKKVQKFKGDRDTFYTVDLAQDIVNQNGAVSSVPKKHSITRDFINVLETSATDLGTFIREITVQDATVLASASEDALPMLLERIFSRKEYVTNEVSIGGTNSVALNQTRVDGNGLTVRSAMPVAAASAPLAHDLPPFDLADPVPGVFSGGQTFQVTNNVTSTLPQAPAQNSAGLVMPVASAPTVSKSMSDEEFMKMFGG